MSGRRIKMGQVIIAVVVSLAAVGAIAFTLMQERNKQVAVAKAFELNGPPCPSVTAAEFTQKGYRIRQTFNYDGIIIGRHSGNVNCSDVKAGGGKGLRTDRVCQFTGTAYITVKSPQGEFYFLPGMGKPATISISNGQAKCVLGSPYTLQSE